MEKGRAAGATNRVTDSRPGGADDRAKKTNIISKHGGREVPGVAADRDHPAGRAARPPRDHPSR